MQEWVLFGAQLKAHINWYMHAKIGHTYARISIGGSRGGGAMGAVAPPSDKYRK